MKELKPKSWMKVAALTGAVFGLLFELITTFPWVQNSFSIFRVVFLGGIFGVAMALFSRRMTKKMSQELPEELKGVPVVVSGPANHFLGLEARGGYLYVTDAGFLFRPHRYNVQSDLVHISWSRVTKVSEAKTLGAIPNGLQFELDSGVTQKFVVYQRNEWLEAIFELRRTRSAA